MEVTILDTQLVGDFLHIWLSNNKRVTFNTHGDCCSESWFEPIDLEKLVNPDDLNENENNIIGPFDVLIGKTVNYDPSAFVITKRQIEYTNPAHLNNWNDAYQNTLCSIVLTNGTYWFLDRNASNGYYTSINYVYIEDSTFTPELTSCRVTLVIGLPCSGKSTYCRNNFISAEVDILDDYLFNFSQEELQNKISRNRHIVINDPRLCRIKIFDTIYTRLCDMARVNIEVIAFENTPSLCTLNCTKLGTLDKITNIKSLTAEYGRLLELNSVLISEIIPVHEII